MKKITSKILQAFAGIALLTACAGSGEQESEGQDRPIGHIIQGEVTGADGMKVQLAVFENGQEILIDSTIVENGKFEISTITKEMREYILLLNGDEMPVVLFLDENSGDVRIKGSVPGFGENYTVEGSPLSQDIKNYLEFLKKFYEKESELYQKLPQTGPNGQQMGTIDPSDTSAINQVWKSLDSISAIKREYAVDYISADSTSPVAWLMLREMFPATGLKNFDTTDIRYFEMVANGMRTDYPYSEYPDFIEQDIQSIQSQIAEMNRPEPTGDAAPEIVLNDRNGKPLALSSLRGKVVLLDFWASWCRPCRMENPNVVRMYEKYKDKGFTVYSVSLDENRDAWLKAIDQDNLSWPNHVSDLKGWQSEGAAIYGVNSIPATYLIDAEGNIIAKNLRGIELERKLEEILG